MNNNVPKNKVVTPSTSHRLTKFSPGFILMGILSACSQHHATLSQPHPPVQPVEVIYPDRARDFSTNDSKPSGEGTRLSDDQINVPTSAEASLYLLAQQQVSNDQIPQASATIERALRINPSSAKGYFQLAQLRLQAGQTSQAVQMAKKALVLSHYQPETNTAEFKISVWELIQAVFQETGDQEGLLEANKALDELQLSIS